MTALLITVSLITGLVILDRVHGICLRRVKREAEERDAKLSVLRVVAKHEALFGGDPERFRGWLAKLLKMQGYRQVTAVASGEDRGYDFTCETQKGQKVWVLCKLQDASRFEEAVMLPEVQRLVGAMVGEGVRRGLIITTARPDLETVRYLEKIPGSYKMEIIDGEKLLQSLYDLRKVLLAPLLETS